MTSSAFIIPCKYSKEVPIIFNCLESIRRYHPEDDIFIVDSNSDDKSYFKKARDEYGATVLDVNNNNYLTGAIWHVYRNHKRDFYYCIHDSVELLDNLDNLKQNDVSPMMYHKHWEWPRDPKLNKRTSSWSKEQIETKTNLSFKEHGFYILQGAILCCKRRVLSELAAHGFNNILPSNKYQEECTERLWGLALGEIGYNEQIRENSILGYCRQGQGLGNDFIRKVANGQEIYEHDGVTYYRTSGGYHLGSTEKVILDGIPFKIKRNKMLADDKIVKYWCSVKRK